MPNKIDGFRIRLDTEIIIHVPIDKELAKEIKQAIESYIIKIKDGPQNKNRNFLDGPPPPPGPGDSIPLASLSYSSFNKGAVLYNSKKKTSKRLK